MRNKSNLAIIATLIIVLAAFTVIIGTIPADVTENRAVKNVPGDYSTIQAALNAVSSGDTVQVAAGTYAPSTNGEKFPITMKNGVWLKGAGADVCIIDAEGTNRVIYFNRITNPSTTIEGFTITNGKTTGSGGGILVSESTNPKITNNIISGNSAAVYGGGIQVYGTFYFASSATIINNVVTDNTAVFYGGGIEIRGHSSNPYAYGTIVNNVITRNSADYYGGGISVFLGTSVITNNVITDNWVGKDDGGGIVCLPSSYSFICNNIVTGNRAGDRGTYGGIFGWGSFVAITFSNVWDNTPNNLGGCSLGYGCISADPKFQNPNNDDYHLKSSSPCIDSGDNNAPALPMFDFDGNPRIIDNDDDGSAIVNMGPFELGSGILATVSVEPETLNLKSEGNWVTVKVQDFPEDPDIKVSQVIDGSVRLENFGAGLTPSNNGNSDGQYMCKIDRLALEDSIGGPADEVELTVTGDVEDTSFLGTCTIKAI
jgi:parallel beta-helix repeat protein